MEYSAEGELKGYIYYNTGQLASSIAPLSDGSFAVGGERWLDTAVAHAVSVVNRDGKFLRSGIQIDSSVSLNTIQVTPLTFVAPHEGDRFLLAQSGSAAVLVLNQDLSVHSELGTHTEEFIPPPPIRDLIPVFERVEAWHKSWTPLLFAHKGWSDLLQTFRAAGDGSFRYFTVAGASSGPILLPHDYKPLCAQGERVVFVVRSGPHWKLMIQEYHNPSV